MEIDVAAGGFCKVLMFRICKFMNILRVAFGVD